MVSASIGDTTMGLCIDDEMFPFNIRVSGNSGCNHFMPSKPARGKGSSGQPPTAQPTR